MYDSEFEWGKNFLTRDDVESDVETDVHILSYLHDSRVLLLYEESI
jgi:hypothetical protein